MREKSTKSHGLAPKMAEMLTLSIHQLCVIHSFILKRTFDLSHFLSSPYILYNVKLTRCDRTYLQTPNSIYNGPFCLPYIYMHNDFLPSTPWEDIKTKRALHADSSLEGRHYFGRPLLRSLITLVVYLRTFGRSGVCLLSIFQF